MQWRYLYTIYLLLLPPLSVVKFWISVSELMSLKFRVECLSFEPHLNLFSSEPIADGWI